MSRIGQLRGDEGEMASMSWKGTRVLADHIKAEASIIIVLGPMSLTNPVNRIPPSISEARRHLLSPSSPSYTPHWGSVGALKYMLCKSYDADFGKFCIFPLMSFPGIPITFSNQIPNRFHHQSLLLLLVFAQILGSLGVLVWRGIPFPE